MEITNDQNKIQTPIQVWMPDGTISAYERTATEQLKIAIIGPPKGGKSRLASTAPKKPIYHFNFDGRLAAISGIAGNFGKEYMDTTDPNKTTAWAAVETDMGMFEYQKVKGAPIPGTFVFDPIDYMSERAMRKVCVDNSSNTKYTRKITVGNKTFNIPGGWDAYSAEVSLVGNMIARGIELGSDIIVIFHERAEEAPDSTVDKKKFTGKVSVEPPRAQNYLPLFNEYWRVLPAYDGKSYKVYTRPNTDFLGATCLKIDGEEPANITTMLEKHKTNMEKEKQNG